MKAEANTRSTLRALLIIKEIICNLRSPGPVSNSFEQRAQPLQLHFIHSLACVLYCSDDLYSFLWVAALFSYIWMSFLRHGFDWYIDEPVLCIELAGICKDIVENLEVDVKAKVDSPLLKQLNCLFTPPAPSCLSSMWCSFTLSDQKIKRWILQGRAGSL